MERPRSLPGVHLDGCRCSLEMTEVMSVVVLPEASSGVAAASSTPRAAEAWLVMQSSVSPMGGLPLPQTSQEVLGGSDLVAGSNRMVVVPVVAQPMGVVGRSILDCDGQQLPPAECGQQVLESGGQELAPAAGGLPSGREGGGV
ncbi:hypothetical protein Dimus_022434, partial [Dionaea muscipula]